jgi:hypothetical protein
MEAVHVYKLFVLVVCLLLTVGSYNTRDRTRHWPMAPAESARQGHLCEDPN